MSARALDVGPRRLYTDRCYALAAWLLDLIEDTTPWEERRGARRSRRDEWSKRLEQIQWCPSLAGCKLPVHFLSSRALFSSRNTQHREHEGVSSPPAGKVKRVYL